ncbi:MAG: dTMP kinase [Candidatus Methylomirabilales bacterium]
MGLLITFEGVEGSGKSTQLAALSRRLKEMGLEVVETKEPGGTRIGEQIRRILLERREGGMSGATELFLYLASRAQLVEEVIQPALSARRIVLSDRFADSSVAYQGYGRSLPLDLIEQLNRFATQGIVPHLTLLLDLAPEVGLARIAKEKGRGLDRLEGEEIAFHRRVREGYLRLAEREPRRIKVIAADKDEAVVEEEVWDHLKPLLYAMLIR